MPVGAGDSTGSCDSKTARNFVLFSCTVAAEGTGELAVKDGLGNCKVASLGVGGLAWTSGTLFVCPTALGEGVWEVVWEELGEYSIFW